MVDITKQLQAGDRFQFGKIRIQAKKMSDPRKFQKSNSHRGKQITCDEGYVFVDKEWRVNR